MNDNRRCDVLIEDGLGNDAVIWANSGFTKLIKSIDGVADVYESPFCKEKYYAEIDARYNKCAVEEEIKIKILEKMSKIK
jgi:hypothetical protein